MKNLVAFLVLVSYTLADSTTEISTTTIESTTLSEEDSNSTAPAYKNNTEIKTKDQSLSVCTCNLQVNWCDIHCCCDPDCTSSDLQIFEHCNIDQNRYVDDRYCNYIQYIYINNTPFEWEVNQKGFFCIISSNLPTSYLVQKDKVLSPSEIFNTSPIWLPPPSSLNRTTQNNYTYGDLLLFVKANSSHLEPLRLPTSLLSRTCQTTQEVLFLKDFKERKCHQIDLSQNNSLLSFSTYFRDIRVLRKPSLFNASRLQCPKNVCLELEPQLCPNQTWTNCKVLNRTKNWDYQCFFSESSVNHCQNAVESLLYRFYHNGTQGLVRVQVLAVLRNSTNKASFTQDFSVEFLWINRSKSEVLSGNPGYLIGKPVLLATKVPTANNLTAIERKLSFLVEFGYNVMRKHYLIMSQNLTNTTCFQIQAAILDQWNVTWHQNHTALFGMYGNCSTDDPTNWAEVIYKTPPTTLLNSTKTILTPKTVICKLATLLDIQVFYSRVTLDHLRNQNKILSVSYTFSEPQNETFWKTNNSIIVSLKLVVRVSFHDVTAPKTKKFVDPPTFDLTLPYDFFYPFVKMRNCASNKSHLVVLIFVLSNVYKVFSYY